jgi:bifunctional non-homologous end joining protein LigD
VPNPDLLVVVLDLDRPPSVDLAAVRRTARAAAALFEQIGLSPYLMRTGSTGYHVVAPLDRSAGFDEVRELARVIADRLAAHAPDELTTEQRVAERGERIFLDTNRNAYGQTAIAPYSPRAWPGAPVATPPQWRELSRVAPDKFTVRTIGRRLSRRDDRGPGSPTGPSPRPTHGPHSADDAGPPSPGGVPVLATTAPTRPRHVGQDDGDSPW